MLPTESHVLGPFIGNVTASSATIWLQVFDLGKGEVRSVFVTLHEGAVNTPVSKAGEVTAAYDNLNVGIVKFDGLNPNTVYYYKLWEDVAHQTPLNTNGLVEDDLYFQTLPTDGCDDHLDFLLMSCHDPQTSKKNGPNGFAVWMQMPEIIQKDKNQNVRFAILAGDQIYADEKEAELLKEPDLRKRQELYLSVYKEFWDNIHYRRVLCSLPAYLMWDDHDITDGWGSREDSFQKNAPKEFKDEWHGLFQTAQSVFKQMQASRNPDRLSEVNQSFDFCFKVGRVGFAVPDLRSNRNVRLPRIMLQAQLEAIRKWVNDNEKDLDVLFFVSSVVFSHDAPRVTGFLLNIWFLVLSFVGWVKKTRLLNKFRRGFDRNVGDLRDDINDSWGARKNAEEADRVLDFLFELQNPQDPKKAINVVILSGDVHTPGYSTIYSADSNHQAKAVIPHVVASPVGYSPLNWLGEAIFRHFSRTVNLGNKGTYTAQISHHFCYRNVVVVSLRKFPGVRVDDPEMHLKVKYYLEYFPEPQIMLFDLNRSSHRENIGWHDKDLKNPLP